MANPRQRRKARSSSHKPVKLSSQANKLLKKQPPIKGPKVLQDAWDKHKTVRQNYAALGLAHSLTPTDSGGKYITRLSSSAHSTSVFDSGSAHANQSSTTGSNRLEDHSAQHASGSSRVPEVGDATSKGSKTGYEFGGEKEVDEDGSTQFRAVASKRKIPRGFGKIMKDESGNVVDVILADESADDAGGESGTGNSPTTVIDLYENVLDTRQPESLPGADWLLKNEGQSGTDLEVVRALEDRAKEGEGRVVRTSSSAEAKYLQRLVSTYGDDYERMARDRKRNVQQYTAGQLKRAMAKAGLAL